MSLTIRNTTAEDAMVIGAMITEFQSYLRSLGDQTDFAFDGEAFLRDGFGPHPAFAGVLAEVDGVAAGYLLYHHGYDTDRGQRLTWVIDLYVREECRRQGVGKALMEAAARACTEAGGTALVWTVFKQNHIAFAFYERLGARYLTDGELMAWSLPQP